MNSTGPQPHDAIEEFREEWLSGYLDGELTAEQQTVVENRLQQDPEARRLLGELQQARVWVQQLTGWDEALTPIDYRRSLASGAPADAHDDGAWNSDTTGDSVGSAGASPSASPTGQAPKQPPTWLRPLAIAASVLVIVGLGYGLYQENSPPRELVRRSEDGLGPGALSMRARRGAGGRTEAGAEADRFPPPPSANLDAAQAAQATADRGGERRPSEAELTALVNSKLWLMRSERLSDERAIASLALVRSRIASSETSLSRSRDDDEPSEELEIFEPARSDVTTPLSDTTTRQGGVQSEMLSDSDAGSEQPSPPTVYLLSFANPGSANAFNSWLSEAAEFQQVRGLDEESKFRDHQARRKFDAAESTDEAAGVSTLSNSSAENRRRRSEEPAARPDGGIGLLLTADELVEIRRQFPELRLRAAPTGDPPRPLAEIPIEESLGRADRELLLLIPSK